MRRRPALSERSLGVVRGSRPGGRGTLSWRSRSTVLLVPVLAVFGCTSLLGIDGNYVNRSPEAGVAVGLGGVSAHGAGGDVLAGNGGESNGAGGRESGGGSLGYGGTGGVLSESGGASSGAGVGGMAAGGSSNGSGGSGNDGGGGASVARCTFGTYVGTYTGTHRTSTGGTVVPVSVGGPVTVDLTEADGGAPILTFTFDRFNRIQNDGLEAKASLAFDCSENSASGPFQADAIVSTALPPVRATISGDVQAVFEAPRTLKGTWSEHERLLPDFAKGSGTWEATFR